MTGVQTCALPISTGEKVIVRGGKADYQTDLPSNAELQAIRVSRQLDQETVMMSYQEPTWQLNCYETYIETTLLRKELEQAADGDRDQFACKVSQLLKSIEVLLWLIAS